MYVATEAGALVLYGRASEQAAIRDLVDTARAGRSGGLVLRGEPGIGKSALLAWSAEHAEGAGLRTLRVTGIEAEADLAFAGLVQLVWPVQERLGALPGPQADTLRAVLGWAERAGRDRFLSGLAVLTLLAEVADDGPLLCLVDDAQWLDQASADALLFAARRLTAEGVAMLFATREEGFAPTGLPELRPSRLSPEDSALLLEQRGLTPASREQVIEESAGNPLALIEFAAAQRRYHSGAGPMPVPDQVLASFRSRIGQLPDRTRLMMVTVAAEGRGHLTTLLGAATALGVGLEDLEEAEKAGLVQVTGNVVTFRHPLVGTAAYQAAPLARRVAVHRALAGAATDDTCRARHLAVATTSVDEDVAAEIVRVAERDRARTAYAAAAGLYEQAANVTPDVRVRAARLGEAASLALSAGLTAQAAELAEEAERLVDDPESAARLAPVRASVEFELGERRLAARLLVERSAHADPDAAAAMLRTSAGYGWFSGDREAIRDAAERLRAMGRLDPMALGMAYLVDEDYARGLPLLAEFVEGALRAVPDFLHGSAEPADDLTMTWGTFCAMILGADAVAAELAEAQVTRGRRHGLVGALPQALQDLAGAQVQAGRHRDAEASVAEAVRIVRDTGLDQRMARLNSVLARVAAIEGDEERCVRLSADEPDTGGMAGLAALSLLDLGLGRHEAALERLEAAGRSPLRYATGLVAAAADQVEAAVRLGEPDRAEEPLRRLEAWAGAGGQPWAHALAARGRALLTDDEDDYLRALRAHEDAGRPFERARTELLHGEWLRRARRRSDARVPLRSALKTFERLRARPWLERARTELKATGESLVQAEPTAANPADRLTSQELQVVRLAAGGGTSREIAAQLFLSPRTVEHHLYRAFRKLGIRSRRELARLELA
ncbi:DNA-binding CsgD family transcriptional regulator [Nonomuraea muscovyensis]|uniref:DNA-binding CsgD family transcriptional regulator n=1 Tax=Nonomuraea muscovyensis TaxID=1124761 RepID=A0A7X0EZ27_9ACTN|nr:AAA family ATPase [Nonomuraea muscovyensis]MBB6346370.1 DNA-binding CsgD family transcriptional regulator [Nonomuraea muscovyensis]